MINDITKNLSELYKKSNINKPSSFSKQIEEMVKLSGISNNSFNKNIFSEFEKEIKNLNYVSNPVLRNISMNLPNQKIKSLIPNDILESLIKISNSQKNIFDNISKTLKVTSFNPELGQMNNYKSVISDLSIETIGLSRQYNDQNILNAFYKISSEIQQIQNSVINRKYVSTKDIQVIKTSINEIKNISSEKGFNKAIHNIYVYIFLIYFFFIAMPDFISKIVTKINGEGSPTPITQKELNEFKRELSDLITANQNVLRITERRCNVHQLSKSKSKVITTLKSLQEVIILRVRHKWIYIKIVNPVDSTKEFGWMKKKYLLKK